MKRIGTVLIFEPHVTREQAVAALQPLVDAGLLSREWLANRHGVVSRMEDFNAPYRIEEYDDEMGGPVWYIP